DGLMARVVGVTLLGLGVYMLVSLVHRGRDFRMRSRWMLAFAGVRRAARWVRSFLAPSRDVVVVTHDHDHDHDGGHAHEHDRDHDDDGHVHSPSAVGSGRAVTIAPHRHRHLHQHVGTLPDDPFPSYGTATAFGVGVLHGIGAETPTQILLF